jgi:hypothetical protein
MMKSLRFEVWGVGDLIQYRYCFVWKLGAEGDEVGGEGRFKNRGTKVVTC